MKRFLGILIAVLMVVTLTATMASARTISVLVNDAKVDFSGYGVEPQIINGRTMVPLRSIFEALNASVEWDDATKTVTSVRGDITVKLTIGAKEMKKNNAAIALDSPAVIVDSRTLVPVRAISEAFGCEVGWDDKTSTVTIKAAATANKNITMGNKGVATRILCETFDSNTAGFTTISGENSIVSDPFDASNKVFRAGDVTGGAKYNHFLVPFEFEAGKTYYIEYDILLETGTDFDLETARFGNFLRFAGKDQGFGNTEGGTSMNVDEWVHCVATYEVPADYMYTPGGDFSGIYADPKDDTTVIFLIDNYTVAVADENLEADLAAAKG